MARITFRSGMQTRAEVYDLIGFQDFEALDTAIV
jgi:hypothetical protein